MREYLKWWTLLDNETKKNIMHETGIVKITYSDIKTVYAERGK